MNAALRIGSRIAVVTLAAAWTFDSASAQPRDTDDFEDKPAATVRLITEHSAVAPSGVTWIAVEFDIRPGWHIYWPGQNDSGYPPTVDWTLPEGVEVGELQWPTPSRHILPGEILDHVLEGKILLVARLTVPRSLAPGTALPIAAHVEWLECAEGCVQRAADMQTRLLISDGRATLSADAAAIGNPEQWLPRPGAGKVRIEWDGSDRVALTPVVIEASSDRTEGTAAIANEFGRATRVSFYPHESGARVLEPIKACDVKKPAIELTLKTGDNERLVGVVESFDADGKSLGAWLIDVQRGVPASPKASPQPKIPGGGG